MQNFSGPRLPIIAVLCFGAVHLLGGAAAAAQEQASGKRSVRVAGSGTDLVNGAIVHSEQKTAVGKILKSTEIIELNGDLHGRVLYHVTSTFDFAKGTLVNVGDEVFSGTIAGSEPVMLHDSRFRFDVNLTTGADTGSVYLLDHIAGPYAQCTLKVSGTGKNADGNPTFNYNGDCTVRDR